MTDAQTRLVDSATEPSTASSDEELGFGEALEAIEGILAEIEGDEVDLDELADALGRAANLLDVCRAKIRRAEREVEQVSQRLQSDED